MKCSDLPKRVVKFSGTLQEFLFADFSRIDLLFDAECICRACDQFGWYEGFANVVSGPCGVRRWDIVGLRMRSDDNDRQALEVIISSNSTTGLQPIESGQFQVH